MVSTELRSQDRWNKKLLFLILLVFFLLNCVYAFDLRKMFFFESKKAQSKSEEKYLSQAVRGTTVND